MDRSSELVQVCECCQSNENLRSTLRRTHDDQLVCELCWNDEYRPDKRYDTTSPTDWVNLKGESV